MTLLENPVAPTAVAVRAAFIDGNASVHLSPLQLLTPGGEKAARVSIDVPIEAQLALYRWMVVGRILDQRLYNLQRQGKLVVYSPFAGQEAAQAGCGLALQAGDYIFPSYRDTLVMIIHGLPIEYVVCNFRGHPHGGAIPADINTFPIQIGIAEQIPHAVGVAWGMSLRDDPSVAVALFGDGATSEGVFHESLNMASVLGAPVIFFCQNNGWAISTPRRQQTASTTLAQKAVAYGMHGVQVDGNDALAVYAVMQEARARARAGQPCLVEALTYRYGPHTTSDDPTRYRPEDELREWQEQRDPIARLRAHLARQGVWSDTQQIALEEEVRPHILAEIETALAIPVPTPDHLFSHTFAQPTPLHEEQRRAFLAHLPQHSARGERR